MSLNLMMRERYVIAIETVGLAGIAGTLVYAIGMVSAGLLVIAVSLVVTAQILRTR
jgi:hypothetical protein